MLKDDDTAKLQLIIEAVEEHGSQRKAARALGMSRGNLRHYLARAQALGLMGMQVQEEALERGFESANVPYYWVKTKKGSYFVRQDMPPSYMEKRDEIIKAMSAHAPTYKKLKRPEGDHLMVMDPADIHVGKRSSMLETGFNYDRGTAVDRVRDGVAGLLSKATLLPIGKILFVIGNDAIHIDSFRNTTTSGTPQDTDGFWWEMFTEAKLAYIAAIEQLTTIADVIVLFCPSNHDWMSGWFLADSLFSWFRNNEHVSFGGEEKLITMVHRKYVVYADALLGFTHGDGAKERELSQLMQTEAREAWGKTRYSYWYVHHTHHKDRKTQGRQPGSLEKDHTSFTLIESGRRLDPRENSYVEYLRSPSAPDGWHHRNGYLNTQAVECFLHDPTGFQLGRFTHGF